MLCLDHKLKERQTVTAKGERSSILSDLPLAAFGPVTVLLSLRLIVRDCEQKESESDHAFLSFGSHL